MSKSEGGINPAAPSGNVYCIPTKKYQKWVELWKTKKTFESFNSPPNNERIIKGELKLRCARSHKWRKRLFILQGHFFYYFRNSKNSEAYRGVICLYNAGVTLLEKFEGKESVLLIVPRTTRRPQWRPDNTRRFYLLSPMVEDVKIVEVEIWERILKVAARTQSFKMKPEIYWGGKIDPSETAAYMAQRIKDEDEEYGPGSFGDGEEPVMDKERKELIEKMIQQKKKAKDEEKKEAENKEAKEQQQNQPKEGETKDSAATGTKTEVKIEAGSTKEGKEGKNKEAKELKKEEGKKSPGKAVKKKDKLMKATKEPGTTTQQDSKGNAIGKDAVQLKNENNQKAAEADKEEGSEKEAKKEDGKKSKKNKKKQEAEK
eukprot:TRINITY_DN1889_c0_g1_i1.p1 TRINITY_DN1889_c0_g1~~TRINITY_DN1889_c0_g1_i1.p1  ORF type:complete len:373 (-),score=133.33 TRINITY_DN1889_c0_g1_i1:54-1172(-)